MVLTRGSDWVVLVQVQGRRNRRWRVGRSGPGEKQVEGRPAGRRR